MPEPSIDPSLSSRIRSGFKAEQTLRKQFHDFLSDKARLEYKISVEKAPVLTRLTLTAAINTIRKTDEYTPNLFRQMLHDQVLVANFQRKAVTDKQLAAYINYAGDYARRHVGRCWPGSLTLPQEQIRDEAIEVFFTKLSKPDFVLTSSLTTYLTGILVRLIRVLSREQSEQRPRPHKQADRPPTQPDAALRLVVLERVRFYHTAHRLIADQLNLLSATCRTIILHHYGVDEQRIDAVAQSPEPLEPLTEDEFDALFTVAQQSTGASKKLIDIAEEVNISLKKISKRHTECLDQLVQKVVPVLQQETDTSFSDTAQQEMQRRLAKANARR